MELDLGSANQHTSTHENSQREYAVCMYARVYVGMHNIAGIHGMHASTRVRTAVSSSLSCSHIPFPNLHFARPYP